MIVAKEQLVKLLKECRSAEISQNEKMIPVLSRNIEVALEEKAKVALDYFRLKKQLAADHSIAKIKEELDEILFDMEDVPEEHKSSTKSDSILL